MTKTFTLVTIENYHLAITEYIKDNEITSVSPGFKENPIIWNLNIKELKVCVCR